jgi:succinate dehydrogenase/fumarate reductase flavoprotein subunit
MDSLDKHILVAGTGLAGCLTALRLLDAGYTVSVIEKMSFPGGISILSGGGVRVSNNWQQTYDYLKETNAGTTPEPVLKDFAQRMQHIPAYLESLCDRAGSKFLYETQQFMGIPNHHYGFTGWQSLDMAGVDLFPGANYNELYPNVTSSSGSSLDNSKGMHLYHTVYSLLTQQTQIRFNTALERLIKENNSVVGAVINGVEETYDAVVLATGGFENAPNMQAQYWQGKPVYHNGFWGNTGDGQRAASAAGADSWHMWQYHGTYGFRMPEGYAVRLKGANVWLPTDPDTAHSLRPLHHIVVDQQGKRFMNEYPPYITDTGHRPLELYSAERVKYDRIPAYFISDETGRQQGPWASVRNNSDQPAEQWSSDNRREIDMGIVKQFDSLEQVANYIGCDKDSVLHTLNSYNNMCDNNQDTDFQRPASSLHRIDTPPYYVAEVYPVVGNTQGGPVHNQHRQLLNSYGEIIPGLYSAGECGSIFGHLYLSAGNLSECFTSSEAILDHLND